MNPVAPWVTAFRDLPRLAQANLVLLGGATVALSARLWPEWRQNPDLSHGFFMPIIFAILIHEARQGRPRFIAPRRSVRWGLAGLLVLALAALFAAGLYAASVDWSHPLVDGSLTAALVLALGAALVIYAGTGLRWIGFNWNALVAIGLWVLCTPIPPGTYFRLTMALQLWVSEAVLRTLHVFGIAAIRHGNIIELARTTVGVEDACSGIRSLISCVFAGLFFSATLVRRAWARAVIIVLSVPLALGMNFLRSLILTLLSNGGVDIAGTWHDVTGFAVLGVTAAILAGLAVLLERGAAVPARDLTSATDQAPPVGQLLALTGTLAVAGTLVLFCVANTRPSVRGDAPVPDVAALLPPAAPGWLVSTSEDLFQFRDTLHTDHMAQRIYRKPGADGRTTEVILYAAYWRPGQASVSLVASHTPDACWPGSGWTRQNTDVSRARLAAAGRSLPESEYRLFSFNGFPQHVWFWHVYDGVPIAYRDPYSAVELLRIAWKYGFRHDGDQLFVRVSSNRPWSELNGDPLFADFFSRTRPLGL